MNKKPSRKPLSRKRRKSEAKDFIMTARNHLDKIPLQPIWNKVRTELKSAVEILGKRTEKAGEKALLLGRQAGVQYHLYLENSKLQKLLSVLGGRIYDLHQRGAEGIRLRDRHVVGILKKIRDLEQKIETMKKGARAKERPKARKKTRSSNKSK